MNPSKLKRSGPTNKEQVLKDLRQGYKEHIVT